MDDIRDGQCPLCRHHEIIQAQPVVTGPKDTGPLALCEERSMWTRGRTSAHGEMATFTCRACGFTQWFAARPADVPIGPKHGTRLIIGPKSNEPFR